MPPNGTSGLSNGKPADGIVGTANPYLHLGTYYMWLTVDHSIHPYLWTTTNPGTGLAALTAFQLPLTNGATAAVSLTAPLPLLGGGQFTWMIGGGGSLGGICTYVDAGGIRYLWVSNNGGDTGGNRVFRVRDPLNEKGLGPVVDIVLGQPNSTSTVVNYPGGNPTQSSLYNPGTIAVDHHGNLYVSDHSFEFTGNARMLRWNKSTLDNTTALTLSTGKAQYLVPADAVYGTNYSFTTTGCYNPPGSWTPPATDYFQEFIGDLPLETRTKIADYLDTGMVYEVYRGISWCRFFCRVQSMGDEVDGRVLGLARWLITYVRHHGVTLPSELGPH